MKYLKTYIHAEFGDFVVGAVLPLAIFLTHAEDHVGLIATELSLDVVVPQSEHLVGFATGVGLAAETVARAVVISAVDVGLVVEIRL